MRPGIEVKEKWRSHVVIASRALSHLPNTLPLSYLTVLWSLHFVNGT